MCIIPQQTQTMQAMPVSQGVFMPQPQFISPVANNGAAKSKKTYHSFLYIQT